MFRKIALSTACAAALVGLAACGSTSTERGVTGAGLGAAAGAFTEKDDVNLGEPIWKWD